MLKSTTPTVVGSKTEAKTKHRTFSLNAKDKYYAALFLGPSLLILSVFVFYPMLRTLYISMFLTNTLGKTTVFNGLGNYPDYIRQRERERWVCICMLTVLH